MSALGLPTIVWGQPLWLAGLALLPLWWLWARRHPAPPEVAAWLRHPHIGALLQQAGQGLAASDRRSRLCLTLAWALLLVALAEPRSLGDWLQPPPQGRDIAFVIDASASMEAEDFRVRAADGEKTVSRMAMVRQVLTDFVAAREADRFSLLLFGSEAAQLTPPTLDRAHVLRQLGRLQPGVLDDHTALGDAMGLALRSVRHEHQRPAIVIVSDGDPSNAGDLQPAEALAVALQLGVAIHTLQIGSGPANADLDAEPQPTLADMARLSGGTHGRVLRTEDAQGFMRAIDALEPTLRPAPTQREVHAWYGVPLLLALLLLALASVLHNAAPRAGAAA